MSNIELIQMKIPDTYKKYGSDNEKSVLYVILNAIANKIDECHNNADRLDAMIGIDTTYNEDLEYKWGSALGISKRESESYDLYRNRLKLAMPSMIGGTKEAIKYAIATAVGIEKDDAIQDDYIDVVDGWEYSGDIDIPDEFKQCGYFICTVDLSIGEGALNVEQKIIDSINAVKASGTAFHILYKAFVLTKYHEMDVFSYDTLNGTTYDSLGVEKE